MKNEEAISVLCANVMVGCERAGFDKATCGLVEKALDMAIEALTCKKCTDLISRAEVLETFSELYWFDYDSKVVSKTELNKVYEKLRTLPSAEPEIQANDLISRQAAKDYFYKKADYYKEKLERLEKYIDGTVYDPTNRIEECKAEIDDYEFFAKELDNIPSVDRL